jgi:hypothetical protein
MQSEDAGYYRARSLAHRGLAKEAPRADVAAIHEQLAAEYEAMVEVLEGGAEPALRVVSS